MLTMTLTIVMMCMMVTDVDAVDDGDDVEEGEKLIGSESGELLS